MEVRKEAPTLAEVKKNIRALLISAPRGLSVDDIEHDYQAMLGKTLPFKHFKCKTPLDFLKTMPDVVNPMWSNGILILKGIADESSKHIAKLVSRQRVNNSKSRRICKAPVSTKPLVVPSYFRENMKELLSVYPHGVLGSALNTAYARHYGEPINYSKLGFRSMAELLNAVQDIVTIVKNSKGGYRICAVVRKKSKTPPPVKKKSPVINAPTSNLPVSKPSPPSAPTSSKLPRANSPSSNTHPARGVYVIPSKRPPTDFNSLEGNTSGKKNEEKVQKKVKDLLDSKSGVSEAMKDELINVLVKRPNGVWAARLPFEYKMLLGKELKVLSMGFYSVIEMASAMPDIFRIERPFPNGDWLLFLAMKSRKDKNLTMVHVPESAIGKGVGYSQQSLPEEFYIELFVTHIRTPDYFWIQLLKHATQLKELQSNMRSFYSSKESAEFMIDDSLIRLGQVCAARFPVDREWYRGLITATPSPLMVEIFYVDYGNSSQVFKTDIRLLKKEFFQLPSQASRCKLANIKPKTAKWGPSAAYRMDELTANKALVGLVSEKKDDLLSLYICDTNGKDDIHVNDILVDEGFAEFMIEQVNGRNTPPGLPPAEASQMEMNQQLALNALQPTFPDYSVPLNLFTGYPTFDFTMPLMNIPSVEMPVPEIPEEKPPVVESIEEEKPSEEDLEFMRRVCEELTDEASVVIKGLNLPGEKVVHVIKFEEKPFVVRSEVSALLWDRDCLNSMLRQIKMVVEKEVVAREDHEELFDELRRLNVVGFGAGEEVKEYALLYPLSTIPVILEAFKCPSSELVKILQSEVEAFNQSALKYWSDESDNSEQETADSYQSEEEHDLEELKLAEKALQFARKRILRAMMNGDLTPGENTVDEADDVEKRLAHIRDLIAKAEAADAAKDTEGCKETKLDHEVIEKDSEASKSVENVSDEALTSSQPTERPPRPVGVTRPAMIRQPSPGPEDNQVHSTTLSTLTSAHPDLSIPQFPSIPHSNAAPYPNLDNSTYTPQNPNVHLNTPHCSDINTHIPHYPNMYTNTPQIPNQSTITGNPIRNMGEKSQGSTVGHGDNQGMSMDREQVHKRHVETTRKTMENISLATAQARQESGEKFSAKKKPHGSVHPSLVPLPCVRQPMGGLPLSMPGAHMTSLPHAHFPFPGRNFPPQFHAFLQPFPSLPLPFPDTGMNLNGPLHTQNLVPPAHLLLQYGSPFPNPRARRAQR